MAVRAFPPLYTRQPNLIVRTQQLGTWSDLVLEHCREHKLWTLTAQGEPESSAADNSNVFRNESIQRAVEPMFVQEIWTHMVSQGRALVRQGRNGYYILWRARESWSALLLEWFETAGKLNEVVTLYELSEDTSTESWEFHGMPTELLVHCLEVLCRSHRATILKDDTGSPIAVKVV